MPPDGTVNPAVEAHRKNAREQLNSLQVFMELNRQTQPEAAAIDLVTLMSTHGETAEPAPESVDRSTDDPEPETK